MTKKHKYDSMKTVEQTKAQHKNENQIPKGIGRRLAKNERKIKINMANKFEMGSKEFAIPEQAKEHYNDEEMDQAQDMYSAIEYESGIDPDEYDSSNKEISDQAKALIEMRKAREKADKKRGHAIFALFSR